MRPATDFGVITLTANVNKMSDALAGTEQVGGKEPVANWQFRPWAEDIQAALVHLMSLP